MTEETLAREILPPLVSIIIATFNAEKTLGKTINSILHQSYDNYEILIVDGNSSDNTKGVILSYKERIAVFVSEPDSGIYDAWNKGLNKASGDWICFLGSGDVLLPNALAHYVNYIESALPSLDYVSSKIEVVDELGKILITLGSKWEWPKFLKYMNTPHVGSFHSKQLFDRYGQFDTSYKVAGDYEFLMRPRNTLQAGFLNEITVKMLFGGISFTSPLTVIEGFRLKTKTGKMPVWKARIDYCYALIKAKIRSYLYGRNIFITLRK